METRSDDLNKRDLIKAFVGHLETELVAIKAAARATYEEATDEESKPENEYDTRGLEASYLAGAQAKRAAAIDEILFTFAHTPVKDFLPGDEIAATALVHVESQRKRSVIFLMPKGGGFSLQFLGLNVQVVTPHSHLGEALVGLREGDSADVDIGDVTREYQILKVR